MKKFLSLVLALVMTMSLVTVSAGAEDFNDDADITYEEAVAVMSEIGIVDGDKSGNFNPTNGLTRGAAAKIICNLILGPTTAAELNADTDPFPDVDKDSTFAGYIAYCAKEGIVGGYADGTFKPANPLTGYAFMKMLLGALGYDAAVEGYAEPNWSINVAKQAIGIGLNAGLKSDFNGSAYVTREEAMLYAFNTLQATMVEYPENNKIVVGGAEVTLASARQDVEWGTGLKQDGNIARDGFVQFAEKYFPKLEKEDATDAFGRPATEWTLKSEEIGTYVNYDLLVAEYTTEVTGKELFEVLGKSAVEDYDLSVVIDGVDETAVNGEVFDASKLAKTWKKAVGDTGNGVLTQVFVDSDAKEITIAIINTYLATTGDYNAKKDTVSVKIYGVNEVGANNDLVKDTTDSDAITLGKQPYTETRTLSGEDFEIEGYKDGDVILVNVSGSDIEIIADPETVDETEINVFKTGSYVSAAGTQYDYADTALYKEDVLDAYDDSNMKNATYKLFLDAYGYMAGIELVDAEDTYVFITGYDRPTSNLYNKTAEAAAIFLDGTMATITVEADATILSTQNGEPCHNTWYTYSIDKNGVYALKAIPVNGSAKISQHADIDLNAAEINKNNVSLSVYNGKYAYGNDETVYLTASTKGIVATNTGNVVIIDDVDAVTTGAKNVSITTIGADEAADLESGAWASLDETTDQAKMSGGVYTLYNTQNGYIVAAVVVGEDDSVSSNYAYVIGSVNREAYDATEDEYTWNRDVIIDGEKVTLEEKGSHLSANGINSMNNYQWYKVSYKADGTVKKVDAITLGTTADTYAGFVSFNSQTTANKQDATIVGQPVYATGYNHELQMVGYTLHMKKDLTADTGIDVLADCKAVVLEQVDGSVKVEYFDGASNNVRNAIDFLHANPFNGSIYAVMDDGLASTIIIDNTAYNQQSTAGSVNIDGKLSPLNLTYAGTTFTATVGTSVAIPAPCTWTMDVYQGGFLVATSGTQPGGAQVANGVFPLTATSTAPIVADGEYTVVVSIVNTANNTVVASGMADMTI